MRAELKPEDVMRALEEFASLNNCNNMRYFEGCGHFCKVLRELIDDMAGGRSQKCNEHCEHYSPPRDEEVFRAALSLLKKYQAENAEKDAEIERLRERQKRLDEGLDTVIRASTQEVEGWKHHFESLYETSKETVRAEAIDEFADALEKHFCHDPAFLGVEQRLIMDVVKQKAKELKGGTPNA